jgi:hypothetical protein
MPPKSTKSGNKLENTAMDIDTALLSDDICVIVDKAIKAAMDVFKSELNKIITDGLDQFGNKLNKIENDFADMRAALTGIESELSRLKSSSTTTFVSVAAQPHPLHLEIAREWHWLYTSN